MKEMVLINEVINIVVSGNEVTINGIELNDRGEVVSNFYPIATVTMDINKTAMSSVMFEGYIKQKISDGNTLIKLYMEYGVVRYEISNNNEYHLLEYIKGHRTIHTKEKHIINYKEKNHTPFLKVV